MTLGAPAYVTAFLSALALAWVLTPLMLRLALRLSVLDEPGERKAQQQAVPYLGGVAIVLAFAATVLVAGLLLGPEDGVPALAAVLGAGVVLSIMGLVDDLRGLGPSLRIAVEVVAGVVIYATEPDISLPGPPLVGIVVTVLWVVLVTNAFNLLDNMDGLSAGVAAIAGLAFCVISAVNGQFLVAALSAAIAGCATGFLRHNFHPAKIYMGDAGSLFLGFLLAAVAVRLQLESAPAAVSLFVPVLVLGVALFDTTLVTVNRLRHGRSPLLGGRDHVSHRLVWVGIPVPVAVGLIYGLALCLGFLGFLLARLDLVSGLLLVGFVLTVGVGVLALLSAVPVYATSRRRQAMLRVVRTHEPEPPAGAGSGVEAAEPLEGLS
ncbi:MAG: undecaprenyl/decaprenyl-phosphate alpha-N-acetylglucosaminyl 1-phosphate transferase [Frankiales bacterium]|jgi:UDP-GlcNAc:undecaprenyl-phosphate GlcNAc-1-phosphate transferase|nr:undecaprenyl/decaprenyl-phosphate alpha-N-acetylglucosaminyl 1-phosphate transferase [Frankiales bacterium]